MIEVASKSPCAWVLIAGVVVGACGGGTPEPAAPSNAASEAPKEAAATAPAKQKEGMSVQTELGEIDERATTRTFEAMSPKLATCVAEGQSRVKPMAGDVAFFVRVGADGKAKFAFLEESTLGDRATERCLLGVLSAADWPKPKGGEAEVRKSLRFDADPGVRAPSEWGSDKIVPVLAKEQSALTSCVSGTNAKFRVTAYVQPDGKAGKIQAVGVGTTSKDGEGKADCIVEAVKGWKLPSPGSYLAKVTFSL